MHGSGDPGLRTDEPLSLNPSCWPQAGSPPLTSLQERAPPAASGSTAFAPRCGPGGARRVPAAEAGQTGLRQGSRRPLERTGGASSLRGPPSERAAFEPRPGLPAGGSQSTGPAPGCSQFPTRDGRRGAWLPPAGVPGNNRKQFWFHWSNKELGKACFLRAAARPSLSVPGREVGEQDPGAPGPFRANAPRVGLGTAVPEVGVFEPESPQSQDASHPGPTPPGCGQQVCRPLVLRAREQKENGDVCVWGAGPALGGAAPISVVAARVLAGLLGLPRDSAPDGQGPAWGQAGALGQGHLQLALGPWAGHGLALAPGLWCGHLCPAPSGGCSPPTRLAGAEAGKASLLCTVGHRVSERVGARLTTRTVAVVLGSCGRGRGRAQASVGGEGGRREAGPRPRWEVRAAGGRLGPGCTGSETHCPGAQQVRCPRPGLGSGGCCPFIT